MCKIYESKRNIYNCNWWYYDFSPPNITAPAETEPQSADNDNGFIDDTKPEEYEYTELQKFPHLYLEMKERKL